MRLLCAALLLVPLAFAGAATATDVEGQWAVDGEATWAMLQADPALQTQFSSLTPAQQAVIRGMVMDKMAAVGWTITAGRAEITDPDGTRRVSTWTVSAIADDTLTIEATDAQGHTASASLTVSGERLIARGFASPAPAAGQPSPALVLRRVTDAPVNK